MLHTDNMAPRNPVESKFAVLLERESRAPQPDALDSIAKIARDAILRATRLEVQLLFARAQIREMQAELDKVLSLARASRDRF